MPLSPAIRQSSSDSIDDRGPGFRVFIIVFLVVLVLVISLRFWSRALRTASQHKSRFWWDDWLALAATVFVLGQLSLTLRIVDLGGGKHVWLVPLDNLAILSKALFATYLVYDTALVLAKASALMFLSRVFPRYANRRWFNISIWVIHSLNVAWYLGIVLGTLLMCNPVQKNWIPTLPGSCGTPSQLYIGSAVPSVAIDLFILILPVPMIWRLHTSRSKKAGITAVFVLGYSSVVVSIGRLATVLTAGDSLNIDFTSKMKVSSNTGGFRKNATRNGYSSTGSNYDVRLQSAKHGKTDLTSNTETEMDNFRHSLDSHRQMLKLSNTQGMYTANVHQVPTGRQQGFDRPRNAIWVNKGVDISRQPS